MTKGNPIGSGTVNLSANAPAEFAAELRRAAFRAGVSFGEFVRRKIEQGVAVEDPVLAARLRESRRRYYGAALLVILCGSIAVSWLTHDDSAWRSRRAGRGVRRVEEVLEIELEEA